MELYCGTTCSRWRCYSDARADVEGVGVGRLDDRLVSHLRRRDPTPRILGIDVGGVSGVVTFWLKYEFRLCVVLPDVAC